MKRILCLLLCLLILFCIGCQKEEVAYNSGAFYTSAGNIYNTHVRITLPEQNLTAPLTSLTVEIHNDTDFSIWLITDLDDEPWRKWADGEWHVHPWYGGIDIDRYMLPHEITPHSTYTHTEDFSDAPWEVGIYRLCAEFRVPTVPQAPPRTGTFCVAETYLVILPAPTE